MNILKPASWKLVLLITALFAVAGIAGILHHELWLDEAHHFLLARDSTSISEMAFNARYEGHPLLWNVLLFALTRFSSNPFGMQVLNLVIATIGVIIFLRFSPFSVLNKLLIVFGYFIFYEYTIISRNYSLVFLLLSIVCALYPERKKHFLLLSVALAFLAQTHLFAAIIAGGFVLLLAFEFLFSNERIVNFTFIAGFFLVLLSFTLVIIQAIPPADHFLYAYDSDPYLSYKRIGKAFSVLWKGLVPLPDYTSDQPWNSNRVIAISKTFAIIPAFLAWFIPLIMLGKRKSVLVFFYFVGLCLVAFIYFSPLMVSARHCGFFFLLLLASLWISPCFPHLSYPFKFFPAFTRFSQRIEKPLFQSLLMLQCFASFYMYSCDWKRPFSNGKNVVEWLKKNIEPGKIILVNDHFSGPPISAYLGKKVYYAENNAEGSFCKWNTNPFMISNDTLLQRISRLVNDSPEKSICVVTNKPLIISHGVETNARLLITFQGALVQAENYWIYELSGNAKQQE
ncbi:MAG: hypothetical protein ABIQ40_18865 [Bacteroidia bacterium]